MMGLVMIRMEVDVDTPWQWRFVVSRVGRGLDFISIW
jgi:hypothetical protein